MSVAYKIISGFYDLIDIFYFTRNGVNPRQAILNYVPDAMIHVLDLCTGTASNSILIASERANAQVIGVDASADMLHIAQEKVFKSNLKNIKLALADATSTPFEAETFDVVILALVLHEVNQDLADRMLSEVYRILKNSGSLIVMEWEQPVKFFKRMMFSLIKMSEPMSFKSFISLNKETYFLAHRFKAANTLHCDYSCVYELKKTQNTHFA